ncbi:hypothetical protein MSAR_45420 [Mycolicibacterium sarraceniae]|uniref:Uncharacterized protein n=1 Tax=Mycolicibacterium sarraceniae TaxID=1534348 RepID=A0A7I7T031_9MYCO|nr:hypothetical protein MSAR_45420 [Mycolicibacterium sarraceniae]
MVAAGLVLSGCGSKASETDSAKSESCVETSGSNVKTSPLNSLSGTMAISKVTGRDAIKLAVDEINGTGGAPDQLKPQGHAA